MGGKPPRPLPTDLKGLDRLVANGASRADDGRDTWVQCDACKKWRRIPNSIAENLSDDMPWYCSDNPSGHFNDCKIPQELSDSEIDAADAASGMNSDEDAPQQDFCSPRSVQVALKKHMRPAVWQLVIENVYTHRKRKKQHEDDIMICQCHNWDKCGPDCLNRVLGIECVEDYCPCAHKCTNQLFTKRQYAGVEVRRAGPKGFGLYTTQDVKEGDFIIEYIGEVLEEEEYLRRKDLYALKGQRHYYFMNIGNGEVIDAARKGNFGRFINHSCDPNCETQKWMVRGELSIGLFAIKDIPANSELTFDYNFERYGDKPLKCWCNSKICRGFVGGALEDDQELALQAVPAEDASNEPVPVMLQEGQGDVKEIEEILDRALSLAEDEWDSQLSSKVSKLALQVGMNWEMLLGKSSKGQAGGGDVPGGASPRIQMPSGCSGSQVQEEIKGEDAGNQEVELEMEPFRGPLKLGLKKQKSLRFLQTDPGADVADSKPKAVKIEEQDWVKSDDEEDDDEEDYDSITILQRGKGGDKVSHKATPSSAEKSSRAGEAAPTRIRDGKTPRDSFFFQDSIQTRDEEREKKEARQARLEELQRRVKEKRAKNASVQQERERQEKERLEKLRMEAPDKEAKDKSSTDNESLNIARRPSFGNSKATGVTPPPLAIGGGATTSSKAAQRRSEVKHQLSLIAPSGKLRDKMAVLKVLRLFNLCDIGSPPGEAKDASSNGSSLSPTQHARMADLSLLLDVVLKTTSPSVQADLIKYGILSQLQTIILRTMMDCFSIVMKKMMRVVEHLPLKQENLLAKRSNHGSFADVLKDLIAHTDLDVRSKAIRTFAVHNIPIPVIMKSEEPKFSVARKSHPPLAALPPVGGPGASASREPVSSGPPLGLVTSPGPALATSVTSNGGHASPTPEAEEPPPVKEGYAPPRDWPPLSPSSLTPPDEGDPGVVLGKLMTYRAGWLTPRAPTMLPKSMSADSLFAGVSTSAAHMTARAQLLSASPLLSPVGMGSPADDADGNATPIRTLCAARAPERKTGFSSEPKSAATSTSETMNRAMSLSSDFPMARPTGFSSSGFTSPDHHQLGAFAAAVRVSSGFSSELQGSTAALLGVTRPPGFVIKPLTGLGSRPPGFGGEISKPPGFGGDTLNRPIATPALAALPPVVKKPQSAIVAAAAAAAKALAASALAAAVAGQSADALARRKRGFSTAFSEDEGKTEEAGGKSLASERPVDNEAVTIGEEVPSAAGPGSLPATQVSAEESDRGNEEPEAEGAGVPPSLPESAPPSTPPPPPPPLSPVSPPLTCGAGPESEAGAGPPMSPMSPMLPDAPLSPMSPGSPGKESLVVQPAETSDATDMEVERGQVPDSVDNSRKCFLSTEAAAQAETDQGNKLLDPRQPKLQSPNKSRERRSTSGWDKAPEQLAALPSGTAGAAISGWDVQPQRRPGTPLSAPGCMPDVRECSGATTALPGGAGPAHGFGVLVGGSGSSPSRSAWERATSRPATRAPPGFGRPASSLTPPQLAEARTPTPGMTSVPPHLVGAPSAPATAASGPPHFTPPHLADLHQQRNGEPSTASTPASSLPPHMAARLGAGASGAIVAAYAVSGGWSPATPLGSSPGWASLSATSQPSLLTPVLTGFGNRLAVTSSSAGSSPATQLQTLFSSPPLQTLPRPSFLPTSSDLRRPALSLPLAATPTLAALPHVVPSGLNSTPGGSMQHLRSQAQAETAGSSGAPAWEAAQENSVASAEAEVAVPVAYPDEWESPTSEFEAFVGDIVKHRIGKYEQPEHPNRITHEEAASIYRKIRREIIAKEHEAYAERQRQKLFKPILRSKLEHRVKEFVRETVKRTHLARGA